MSKQTLTSGGATRWYFREIPPTAAKAAPLPLVVDLHGYAEGAALERSMSGLEGFGATHGFVTATPQGSGPVPMWDIALGSSDLAFVGAVMDDVEAHACIDTNRVYVAGLSNGAFMTSAVACEYSARVAAVAPVAGVRMIPGCKLDRPVPVVAFHGTADNYVAYTGGMGPLAATLPAADGSGRPLRELPPDNPLARIMPPRQPIPDVMQAWATRNGCPSGHREQAVASDVTRFVYNCPPDASVLLYRVTGGGHSWPGSTFAASLGGTLGKTTMSIDTNEIMWEFFRNHPLRASH